MSEELLLQKEYELGFTYTRSTGPVVGRFLGGLKKRTIIGGRLSDGRVVVPPMEFDPITGEALSEFINVSDRGVVESWCWVAQPRSSHPSDSPFAWAMIKLDGADIPMIHCIFANSPNEIKTGLRVRASWVEFPSGSIRDIAFFELEE